MVCAHPDQLMLTVDVGTGERKGWREEEERVSGGRVRVGIRQQSVHATGPFWDRHPSGRWLSAAADRLPLQPELMAIAWARLAPCRPG